MLFRRKLHIGNMEDTSEFEHIPTANVNEEKNDCRIKNDYIIVRTTGTNYYRDIAYFIKKVNEKKKQGWKCAGGHVIVTDKNKNGEVIYHFSQAMEIYLK